MMKWPINWLWDNQKDYLGGPGLIRQALERKWVLPEVRDIPCEIPERELSHCWLWRWKEQHGKYARAASGSWKQPPADTKEIADSVLQLQEIEFC